MRTIFVLLLIANVAYLSWNLERQRGANRSPAAAEQLVAPSVGQVRRLVLLSEKASQRLEPAQQDEAPMHAAVVSEPEPMQAQARVAETASSGAAEPAVEAQGPPATVTDSAPTPEKTATGEAPPGGSRVAAAADKSAGGETGSGEQPVGVSPLAGTPPTVGARGRPAEAQERACYTLGPLKSRAVASRLLAVLRNRAVAAQLREEHAGEPKQYWVYFPPFASREAANQVARSLRAKGFTDYFVVTKGELGENAIAAGVFNHMEGVQRRLAELRALGYEAQIAPRGVKASTRYWIDYRLGPESRLKPDHLQVLVGNGSEAQVRPRGCAAGVVE